MIGTKKIKVKFKAGYTLVELLVSLGVISMLTVIFLSNYHNADRRTDLIMTTQTLITDIRFAQSNALGLVRYNGEVPAGGWGIHMYKFGEEPLNSKYILFADVNNNQQLDEGEADPSMGGKEIDLPPDIDIYRFSLNGTIIQNDATITFLPPDPITNLRVGSATGTDLQIILQEKLDSSVGNPSQYRTVGVNFLGLIDRRRQWVNGSWY